MTEEVLNKANDLTIKLKKLDDSIYKVEQEVKTKKRFNADIINGRRSTSFRKWLDKFGSVFLNKDGKPSIRAHAELHYPVEIELEDEEFFNILIEYMKQKRNRMKAELEAL